MSFLDRFLRMLAEHYVGEMRVLWVQDAIRRQQEAYQIGVANGQLLGQRQMLAELERQIELSHPRSPEITVEDLARVKKGLVH